MSSWLIRIAFFLVPIVSFSQVNNDDCVSALFIRSVANYCSDNGAFSNINSEPSIRDAAGCWGQGDEESDVWYSFSPAQPGVFIQLFGESANTSETLDNSAIAIYQGSCGSLDEVACANVTNGLDDIVEITLTDLVIGRIYYVRVSSAMNSQGTFQLCLDEFKPIKAPEADCRSAVVLCDKSSFFIENLQGVGDITNEVEESCIQEEFASAWYTWTAENSGSLTFTITPNNERNPEEDLDFAIYRLPNGLGDCSNKELVRCMASGETQGQSPAQNAPCFGATGLRSGDPDLQELPGCGPGDNNFLSPLEMIAGESYALVVNNFSKSGLGFNIEFGGNGRFLGPTPIFNIEATEAFECDKTIVFTDESQENTDQIIGYTWNFGEGALPLFADGPGPHDVLYESFGDKVAALTVETLRGCTRTEIVEFNVAACCSDTSDLSLSSFTMDLICAGVPDGFIEGIGLGGFPDYLYNLNNEGFQPAPVFNGLFAGDYTLGVQDKKGCEEIIDVTITEPLPLEVFVSEDDSVDLGFSIPLSSGFSPDDRVINYEWGPARGLSCSDCPDPIATPPGTTTYILTITDQDGCTATDDVVIFTPLIRPIAAPNIISITSNNNNSFLWLTGNAAAVNIEVFSVFDRWGSKLFSQSNIPISDVIFDGWDGRVNGKFVNPGVYVWVAEVRFVDDEILVYKGDVTVIR